MDLGEKWAMPLHSELVDDQVTALRQISAAEIVTGITVRVVQLAGSSHDEVRMWSAEALETSIQPSLGEVFGLRELLGRAADGEVCYWAATMLGRLGSQAVSAVNELESCVRESMYLPAREQATWCSARLGRMLRRPCRR